MPDNKIAVVTGGSRGIGKAVCKALAPRVSMVYINFVSNEDAARQVQAEIASLGGKAELLPFDVSDSEAVSKAMKKVISDAGGVHVLVNNAGITRDSLLARMKEGDWNDVIATNLTGMFNCTKAVLMNMMKQRWGRIINIGSVVGAMGNPGQANYAAAKAGIEGFTKSLAREVASRGITANVVSPGFIDTDMTQVLSDKIKEGLLAQIPAGRFGTPEDVASAVAFLASDSAAYITGHVLHVNGGLLCQ